MTTAQNYANLVQELYVAYFGRPADYDGLNNFESALLQAGAPVDAAGLYAAYSSNATVQSLIDAFGTSKESAALYANTTTEGFVNAIYENLFNRAAANQGLEFWAGAIESGKVTPGEAALAIAAGAESNSSAQGLIDWQTVTNKAAAAAVLTEDLGGDSGLGSEYAGADPAMVGRNYVAGITNTTTAAKYASAADGAVNVIASFDDNIWPILNLTTGVDSFVVSGPGNNRFDGVLDNAAGLAAGGQPQTLNSGDSIVGGTQLNFLDLTDFGLGGAMSIPAGTTFANITSLVISSLEAVAGDDYSQWASVTSIQVFASTGNDDITAGAAMSVSVRDSLGNITITGGDNDSASTDNAHTVTISSSAARFQASVGDSASSITDTTVGASVNISVGAGATTVTLGANALGTITLAAHTGADAIVLGASGASLAAVVTINGLNNTGGDTLTFANETAATLHGFTQVTQVEVAATGANPALLQSWVAAADGAAGSGITGNAHGVTWFQYQGQTFVLESVAGQSADAGIMAAGNTLVELTGTAYTFAHATGANGTIHLLG